MIMDFTINDPDLTLERAKFRIIEQNAALADLRAEVRTLGNTAARTEKALWAERESLADARRHLEAAQDELRHERAKLAASYRDVSEAWGTVLAERELTLWGHLKVWWERRPVWRV